jgi:hypothetical protein
MFESGQKKKIDKAKSCRCCYLWLIEQITEFVSISQRYYYRSALSGRGSKKAEQTEMTQMQTSRCGGRRCLLLLAVLAFLCCVQAADDCDPETDPSCERGADMICLMLL